MNYLHSTVLQEEEGLPLIDKNIKEYLRNDVRHDTVNKSFYFRSQSLEELRPLVDLFLNE